MTDPTKEAMEAARWVFACNAFTLGPDFDDTERKAAVLALALDSFAEQRVRDARMRFSNDEAAKVPPDYVAPLDTTLIPTLIRQRKAALRARGET